MNLSIVPFEQLIAEGLTGAIISGGQGGDAAKITKRANTALAVIAGLNQINGGDAAGGVQALSAAISSADLDPGVSLAVQGLFTIAAKQAQLLASVGGTTLIGGVAEQIYANVASGVSAAANAELAKYQPKSA